MFKVHRFKPKDVMFEKPLQLGFTILKLSKLKMNETLYNQWQPFLSRFGCFLQIVNRLC